MLGSSGSFRRAVAIIEYVVSSDGPYRFNTRSAFVCAYRSSTRLFGSASPPRLIVLTELGIPATRTNSVKADGTPLISVTSADFSAGSSSAFSTRITLPPHASGANNSKSERSKHSEVENNVRANSSGVNTVRDQLRNVTVLRCSTATPFGNPVEPDV